MRSGQLPVVIGVGQIVKREGDLSPSGEPLAIMAEAAALALEDSRTRHLAAHLDAVAVVNILSWTYEDPAGQLAGRLGAAPRERIYTAIGGNTPQWMVNELADRLSRGEITCALLAGAEAMYTRRLGRQLGIKPPWSPSGDPGPLFGDLRWGNCPTEQAHRAQMPTQVYPLFENALRAKRGQTMAEQRAMLGRLAESFTAVAAENPFAWFREARAGEELACPSPTNRMIGFPYPKFLNAIMDVDQAAALVLTTVDTARRLGVPEERWIYLWGSGDATDLWFVSDRVDFTSSPAIREAGKQALAQAGIGIERVDDLDLYSCFPCAPQIAAAMLGMGEDDARPLTVTGGLAYAGGPGNNYVTHAIATMVERLRRHTDRVGLVTGLGWYLTKHAVGIYSASPPSEPRPRVAPATYQAELDALPHPTCVEQANGAGHIETYTVLHDREGNPETGLVVGRLVDGSRFWANTPSDRGLLEEMESREFIGRSGRVRHDPASGVNTFEPG